MVPSLNKLQRHAVWTARRKTSFLRALPDFLIVGAMKAGTTSLFDYLCEHPRIEGATTKEVRFFERYYHLGPEWYRSHFPMRWEGKMCGEASPGDMFNPRTVHRLPEVVPDAKLIILLRNPTERAYSHHQHNVRKGREPLSFEDAIEAEEERLDGELERILNDGRYVSDAFIHYSYRARGLYADQIQALQQFYPADQILILQSERLYSDTQAVYEETLRFLDLPPHRLSDAEAKNAGSYKRKRTPTHEKLDTYFKPYNEQLFSLLGQRYDW